MSWLRLPFDMLINVGVVTLVVVCLCDVPIVQRVM
jgi:hypothetical protein